MATTDEVRLAVPARPEFLRLARVTAAGLASRLGFNFDEVEDLRLAIDELCYTFTGAEGRDGTVSVRYLLSRDRLIVEGRGNFGAGIQTPALTQMSEVILDALVDEHVLTNGPEGPMFRLVKSHHSTDGSAGG